MRRETGKGVTFLRKRGELEGEENGQSNFTDAKPTKNRREAAEGDCIFGARHREPRLNVAKKKKTTIQLKGGRASTHRQGGSIRDGDTQHDLTMREFNERVQGEKSDVGRARERGPYVKNREFPRPSGPDGSGDLNYIGGAYPRNNWSKRKGPEQESSENRCIRPPNQLTGQSRDEKERAVRLCDTSADYTPGILVRERSVGRDFGEKI